MKKLFFLLALSFGLVAGGNAYYFGLKSADDSVADIQRIEAQFDVHLPLVGFIFDPREHYDVPAQLEEIADTLGTTRVYHITISPNTYSAQEVAEGKFDQQYLTFFQKIKEKNLKVIFRTMHEMNGGRYPRASNPTTFKQARKHVRNLSRVAWLDQNMLLFDFSVNHRDMPTKNTPSQTASLYECTSPKPPTKAEQLAEQKRREQLSDAQREAEKKAEAEKKKKEWLDCPKFEDYYPGDAYVDVVGFTFYNRGKATSNRQRLSPEEILFDSQWQTYERLKTLGKPLIIDEVGTTAVYYPEKYTIEQSRRVYLNETEKKETRLKQLQTFLETHPELLGAVYFNVDYTYGLQFPTVGEADRAIIDNNQNKIYQGFFDLYQGAEPTLQRILTYFMNAMLIEIDGQELIIPKAIETEISVINDLINQKADTPSKKLELVNKLKALSIKDAKIQQSLELLKEVFQVSSSFKVEK